MFKQIASGIQFPQWVENCPRYKRLDLFDRLLDGTFYDHIPNAFYDETDQSGRMIEIKRRRPSVQYRFCGQVASYAARKLFAGNHAPRIMHKDEASRKSILRTLRKARWLPTLLKAAKLGSVGSVAVTFRVQRLPGVPIQIGMNVWRSKYCEPTFDSMGELTGLRLQYVVSGSSLIALDAPEPREGEKIDPAGKYWFVRDYGMMNEVTFKPVLDTHWDPVGGFLGDHTRTLQEWENVEHGLGFVPAHWFRNLVGGTDPDGDCTFEPGIPNSIELDFTMSQIGRGVRYNAAPQLVVKGMMMDEGSDGAVIRGASDYIHLAPDVRDQEGGTVQSGSDAKLLEMAGTGTEASLRFVDKLHDMALEAVAANRKDPERMKGPMSGRAMEFIDQEFYDLVMELRTQYGEYGALPLIRKMIQAVDPKIDLSSLTLIWPRLFQPTPTDLAQVIPALCMAIDPLKAGPATPAEAGTTGADGISKPGKSATTGPDPAFMLLTPDQARAWLAANMDMAILHDDEVDPEEPHEDPPGAVPEDAPEPIDITAPAGGVGTIPNPTHSDIGA